MATACLSLGTNMGEKNKHITTAIRLLGERAGTILALSRLYENPPWGFESDNDFLNAAMTIETALNPFQLLDITQQIEREMGRTRKTAGAYRDRIIDIDILLYDDLVLHTARLTLPHPHMHERRFALIPLAEIAPSLAHPLLKKTVAELALLLK
jgi:2-amino-4-hydroxy-6-hydroxymethyldihydropteridine diphosphokinase